MQSISGKAVLSSVVPAEWNSFADELEGLILSIGEALDGGDTTQVRQAVAAYAAISDFYTDGGSANTYTLTPIASFVAPNAYANGMRIRFRAANANTGASTVNVASIGAVNLLREDGSALTGGDITTLRDVVARYDGSAFRIEAPTFLRASSVAGIQTAVDALPATGGTVDARSIRGTATIATLITVDKPVTILLGDCTFTVTATQAFQLGDGARVIGAGMGRTVFFHDDAAAANDTPLFRNVDFTNGNTVVEVAHLSIDGNKSNQGGTTDAEGFRVQHCSDLSIHDVEVMDTVGIGIRGFHPRERTRLFKNRITNCAANETPRGAIYFTKTTTTGGTTDTIEIYQNDIDQSGSNSGCIGVAFTNSVAGRNIRIYDNSLIIGDTTGSFNFGIEVFAEDNPASTLHSVHVHDNDCRGENGSNTLIVGVSIAGREITRAHVHDNACTDCGGRSLEIVCGDVAVHDNTERNCGGLVVDINGIAGAAKTFTGVSVTCNVIDQPSATSGGLRLINGGTHTGLGWNVRGNIVRTPAGNGIQATGQLHDLKLSDNVVTDDTSAAAGSHAIVTEANGGQSPARVQYEGNVVEDWNPGSGGAAIRINGNDHRVKLNHFEGVGTEVSIGTATGTRYVGYSGDELVIQGVIEVSSGHLVTVSADTLTLDESAAFDYEIIDLVGITSVGSIDVSVEINGTPVTGMDTVTVDTTQDTLTASAANAVSAGDRVTLVLENPVSSPQDFAFTIRTRRV